MSFRVWQNIYKLKNTKNNIFSSFHNKNASDQNLFIGRELHTEPIYDFRQFIGKFHVELKVIPCIHVSHNITLQLNRSFTLFETKIEKSSISLQIETNCVS